MMAERTARCDDTMENKISRMRSSGEFDLLNKDEGMLGMGKGRMRMRSKGLTTASDQYRADRNGLASIALLLCFCFAFALPYFFLHLNSSHGYSRIIICAYIHHALLLNEGEDRGEKMVYRSKRQDLFSKPKLRFLGLWIINYSFPFPSHLLCFFNSIGKQSSISSVHRGAPKTRLASSFGLTPFCPSYGHSLPISFDETLSDSQTAGLSFFHGPPPWQVPPLPVSFSGPATITEPRVVALF
ncbi:hypothetical protein BJV78DRAFT_107721 [Lactifluus subvellereus]|nr:hypothetical protein BJV78DRAFT_107721 [Lactifluus subvellereus]